MVLLRNLNLVILNRAGQLRPLVEGLLVTQEIIKYIHLLDQVLLAYLTQAPIQW